MGLGILAALAIALTYGVGAEILGITWGLLIVGLFGGWVVGAAVRWGAWRDEPHAPNRRSQWVGLTLAVVAWVLGLAAAYFISQALIPEASTTLAERLSVDGFVSYFGGLFDFLRFVHLTSLALLAFMAWRTAR